MSHPNHDAIDAALEAFYEEAYHGAHFTDEYREKMKRAIEAFKEFNV